MHSLRLSLLATLVMSLLAASQDVANAPAVAKLLPKILLNDNHQAAGHLSAGVLEIALVADRGLWYPASESEPGIPIDAFREANAAPQIPGPLIRVPAGTELRASIQNTISGTKLVMHGLSSRPASEGKPDELTIGFGETKEIRIRLDVPGTYFYWGTTTKSTLTERYSEDSQLSGAIIVDPPGTSPNPNEEIFVIGIWVNIFRNGDRNNPFIGTEMAVINGRSWPNTQRFSYTQGDSVHWRWINGKCQTIHVLVSARLLW